MTDAEKRMERAEQILVEAAREMLNLMPPWHVINPALRELTGELADALHDYDRAMLDI